MKEKVLSINLRRLKDGQFVEFVAATQVICAVHGKVLKLDALLEGYSKALENLEGAYKKQKTTLYTEKIQQLDETRDRAFLTIYYFVKAKLHDDSEEKISAAAKSLMSVISLYGAAKIVRKDYNQESAILDNMLKDIKNQFATEATLLGIDKNLQFLAASNEEFKKNYDSRGEQMQANDMLSSMYDARSAAVNIYLAMVRQIHAISFIAKDQLLAKTELVARLNEEVKKYKLLISPKEDEGEEDLRGW